jgi:L,D-transpeptidase ErfK/SrfK
MRIICRFFCSISFFLIHLYVLEAQANVFHLPIQGDIVGQLDIAIVKKGDIFPQIARDYDVGYTELAEANPNVDPENLIAGTTLVIPNQFVLPNAPRKGLVINLAEMRLYFYPSNTATVITHPLGIGREGENTPVGVMQITEHVANPTWTPTENMRNLRAQEGIILPKSVPPGPDNPMGKFKMRLSNPTYLIHGTNDPLGGIGRRSSSGCIRLYPEDIETLYHQVKNSTYVYIVNQPYKIGWLEDQLYVESHAPIEGALQQDQEAIENLINQQIQHKPVQVAWGKAIEIVSEKQGWPQPIGRRTDNAG